MKSAGGGAVFRELQQLIDPGTVAGLTERQVLARFVARRDPVAFEAIVARHGPMVLAVCRQMLKDANDVDDAFQATFVILIKKASTLRQPERLGPWLYGVAYRVAHRARNRRRLGELPGDTVAPSLGDLVQEREQIDALHDEIQHLPDKYRLPIVLCCLEGLSHDEAARQLGWVVGTIHGRLSRARDLLRGRLDRRGVTLASGIPQALLLLRGGRIVLPESVRRAAVALASGTVPARLETLIKGVLTAMFIEKLKAAGLTLTVAAIGVVSAGSVLLAFQSPATNHTGPSAGSSAREINPGSTDDPRRKAGDRLIAAANAEKADEEAVTSLELLRVEAELLEIEIDREKAGIRRDMELLRGWARADRSEPEQTTKEQKEENDRQLAMNLKMVDTLSKDRQSYSKHRMRLALLKRQIARAAKALNETDETAAAATAMSRRLDRLEEKVDRIVDVLSAKPHP